MTEQQAIDKLKYTQSVIKLTYSKYVKARVQNKNDLSKDLFLDLQQCLRQYNNLVYSIKILFPELSKEVYFIHLYKSRLDITIYSLGWYLIN